MTNSRNSTSGPSNLSIKSQLEARLNGLFAADARAEASLWVFRLMNADAISMALGEDGGQNLLRQFIRRIEETMDGSTVYQLMPGAFCTVVPPKRQHSQLFGPSVHQSLTTFPYMYGNRTSLIEVCIVETNVVEFHDVTQALSFLHWISDLARCKNQYSQITAGSAELVAWRKQRGYSRILTLGAWKEHLGYLAEPLWSLERQAVTTWEVRLKVKHGRRWGSPRQLLDSAGLTGHAATVDLYTLEKTVACLLALPAGKLSIIVNVSLSSLIEPDFFLKVSRLLNDLDAVRRSQLGIQIKEAFCQAEPKAVRLFCGKVNDLGCRVILQNFGQSFASLQLLGHCPVFLVKMWPDFVNDASSLPPSAKVFEALSEMLTKLGIAIALKGVSTREELAFAARQRIQYVQGPIAGRPVPLHECIQSGSASSSSQISDVMTPHNLLNSGR